MEEKNKTTSLDYILLTLVAVSVVLIVASVWSDVHDELVVDIHETHGVGPNHGQGQGQGQGQGEGHQGGGSNGSGYGKTGGGGPTSTPFVLRDGSAGIIETPEISPTPEPTYTMMPFGEDE